MTENGPAEVGKSEILTAREAATYLRVSVWTVWKALSEGRLPGRKVGREWRLHRDALDAFLGARPRPNPMRLAERPYDRERKRVARHAGSLSTMAETLAKLSQAPPTAAPWPKWEEPPWWRRAKNGWAKERLADAKRLRVKFKEQRRTVKRCRHNYTEVTTDA